MDDSPLALALAHHQAGRLEQAEAAYGRHLASHPDDSEALHLLGVLRHQQGRSAEGRDLIRTAIARAPDVGAYHANLGIVETTLGDNAAAVSSFDRACLLTPAVAGQIRPLRAAACLSAGDNIRAEAEYALIVAANPDDASAWRGLALARHAREDVAGALPAYRRAVALAPDDVPALNGLGAALLDTGSAGEALAVLERAAKMTGAPWGPLLANLGNARRATGDGNGAVAALRQALACEPGNVTTLANLAAVLSEEGMLDEAAELCRRALRISPDDMAVRTNLAACLFDTGDVEAAFAMWQSNASDPRAGSNALYAMNFLASSSRASMRAAARDWARRHASSDGVPPPAFANRRDPDKRLRIGLVSPDLRSHSVAWFLLPVLEALRGQSIEIHAFSELAAEDPITARIREHVAGWHPTVGLGDAAVAAAIRQAGIDILIDLAGHTAGSRLGPFALRAAPVQASWLGYPDITGIDTIDWRITDALIDPPETDTPDQAGERPLRLAAGFHAYRLPDGAPAVQSRNNPDIVFGSFNNWPKHGPDCLAAWAEILSGVPGSRLVLKNKAMGDPATREAMRTGFAARGIDPGRIEALARVADPRGHLALYGLVDIALDPFPYNGVTTTCEALSMGVPVVALRGTTSAGRTGAALLERIGCAELVAESPATYIRRAIELAGDQARLAIYRSELRGRMERSPMGNPVTIAGDLVAALRGAWADWCRENPAG